MRPLQTVSLSAASEISSLVPTAYHS